MVDTVCCPVCGEPLLGALPDYDAIHEQPSRCPACSCLLNLGLTPASAECLDQESALLSVKVFYNPVRCGIIKIGTSLRKSRLADIGGMLQNAREWLTTSGVTYAPINLEKTPGNTVEQQLAGLERHATKFDFIYLGEYLSLVDEPKVVLKKLKTYLKNKGVIQILVRPEFLLSEDQKHNYNIIYSVPALTSMLVMLDYVVIPRLCVEGAGGLIICAQA